MNQSNNKNKRPAHKKCESCCKQIPESTAKTAEGADYIYYFCGTTCYDEWHKNRKVK